MARIFFCVLGFLFFEIAAGQSVAQKASANTGSAAEAVSTFYEALSIEKEIYTGPEHFGYLPTIEGFAYFTSKDWQQGAVLYNGILYEKELLLYDLVTDKLLVKRFDGFPIELRSDKVGYFTIPGHTFVYMNAEKEGPKSGFYDQLAAGALTILARHTKVLEEKLEETRSRQRFIESTAYYALKNNKFYSVNKLSSVLDLLHLKKGTIQQQLKKNGIKFKKNKELALTTIAALYNKTQP